MLALALVIAAGAPNAAWALLDARTVVRGSNRRLSTANFGQLKLVAADAASGDYFGNSVAIDGGTVVIGAKRDDDAGSESGSVYVLRTTDGGATYGQVAKLTASDAAAYDRFGHSVAIDGNTVVVGADGKDSYTGAAYVFRTSDGGATYDEIAKLTASDGAAYDEFGISVAIDGDTVVVGAYNDGNTGQYDYYDGAGSAYVFRTTDDGVTYDQVAKLTAADVAASDEFGWSVAVDGDTIAVGAHDWGNDGPGAAYVFRTTDGGVMYGQVAKLAAADGASGDEFGFSVAIAGDTVVVGASGGDAAYFFRTSDGGVTYGQVAKLTASDAVSHFRFGHSVAIDGDTVVVGAIADDDACTDNPICNSGAAYVFRTSDGGATYVEVAKLTASDAAADDYFGTDVAIAGDTIVVGTYAKNFGTGAVYVFSPQPAPEPSTGALGSDAATRTGPLLALLVAAVLAL
jgi:hypothetical protein